MSEDDQSTVNLQTRLHAAVERREFELHVQPIVDLGLYSIHAEKPDALLRSVRGVEALLRWREGATLHTPGDFLDALESDEVMHEVNDWIAAEAFRIAREWRAEGLDLEIWINLSTRALLRTDFADRLGRTAAAAEADPKRFVIELTDASSIAEYERTAEVLEAVSQLGFRVAIDDFGVGESSLAQQLRLPIDILKIDGTFIADVETDQPARRIVTGIVALGRNCGHVTVAEWVETREQCEFLIEQGCELAQGYYFLPPFEPSQVLQLLGPSSRDS